MHPKHTVAGQLCTDSPLKTLAPPLNLWLLWLLCVSPAVPHVRWQHLIE